jgi:ribosomal protein L13E
VQKKLDQAANSVIRECINKMHHVKAAITSQSGKQRPGKGFSPDELSEAGVSVMDARKMQIPVDWKRRSSHEENIASLKSHNEKAKAAAKPKTKTAPKEKKAKN